jgi:hypothetical protein
MRAMIVILLVAGIFAATSCREGLTPAGKRSSDISAVGIFGGAAVNIAPTACAGRATLTQGSAQVKDECFTGDTNVVLCTDVTNVNPVRCAPEAGSLLVAGSGSDVIAYARMR